MEKIHNTDVLSYDSHIVRANC